MEIIVNDTNIFIDLHSIGLLRLACELPYEIRTVDFVMAEIVDARQHEEMARLVTEGKKINMEFKRNNQLYKNIYNPIYKRFIAASQILIDFLKYPFGDYFCYLF